ncbi:MAG: BatA domain-containing protein [Flavobacteriales bacterium]
MIYQNPQILYALLALVIPIIIHLFNFRKHEKVYFSSIRFLEEIKTQNKKKRNIKNLLILLSRIFALLFLILAFAKPYIPNENNSDEKNNIFIYIDNSFSMNAISEKGRLLDIAKNTANSIISSYPNSSNFYLLTNNFSSLNSRLLNKEKILEEISKVETNGSFKSLNEILNKKESISKSYDQVFLLSDFQANTTLVESLNWEDKDNIHLIPIQSNNVSNISLDSVWIDGPILIGSLNQNINIKLSSVNVEKEIPITLEINNKQKIKQLIKINSGRDNKFNFKVKLDSNINICKVYIEDYPITFDNEIYFNLNKSEKIKISSIYNNEKLNYIEKLFLNDTINYNYSKQSINSINYQKLKENDVIILDEVRKISSGLSDILMKCMTNGVTLIIIPSNNIDLDNFNEFFKLIGVDNFGKKINSKFSVKEITKDHPIFKNVFEGEIENIDYPIVKNYYSSIKSIKSNKKPIYTLENNEIFLSNYNNKKSNIYVFNTSLNDSSSNFHKHALFVPTFLNMANNSLVSSNIYNVIKNDDYFISIPNNNEIFNLKNDIIDIIPTSKLVNGKNRFYTNNQIKKSGQYILYNKKKSR